MKLTCLLTCPHCGYASLEPMPTERCVEFHECDACHLTVAPKEGDCCVYRSYGDSPCPCALQAAGPAAAEHRRVA